MRFPWVSRELLNLSERRRVDAESAHQTVLTALDRQLRRLYDERDDLLEKYHALASPSPTLTTVAGAPLMLDPSDTKEPSVIGQTIREQCETADGHTDHALARHLRSYARQLKQSGKTDDEIVAKLVAWQSSEPEDNVARMAEAG